MLQKSENLHDMYNRISRYFAQKLDFYRSGIENLLTIWKKFVSENEYTRCASIKCGFQITDGAPEQFVL